MNRCAPLLAVLLLVWAEAAFAKANNSDGLQGYVALGTGLLPDYEGASKYVLVPYLDGQANFENYFLRFDGGALQLNVLNSSYVHAGPLIGYRMGRGAVYDPLVARMHHIRYSITDGGFIEFEHLAKDPRSGERVTLSVAEGNINYQSGLDVTLRALAHRPLQFIDPGLIATAEVDATWGDGKFTSTYFGVSQADSLLSGFAPFHADSGIKSAGLSLALDQFLSPKWSIGMRAHYARLLGDAAASPVTARAGSPNQFFGGIVVGCVL